MIYYLYDPREKLHTFFTHSLAFELRKQSNEVFIINEAYSEEVYMNVKDEDYFVYIIHPIYLFKDEEVLKTIQILNQKKTKKILYITEPLTLMMDRKNYRILLTRMKIFESWTYTYINQNFLNGYRIRRVAPLFSKEYQWVSFSEKKKNIDKIIFIGNPTKSRMGILQDFGDRLVMKTEGLWEKEDWKNMLIENVLFMNIHRIPKCPCLETMRITPLLSNGGFIISENVNENEMEEYKDFNIIFGKREELYNLYLQVIQNWDWNIYEKRWIQYCERMKMEEELKKIDYK